MMCINTPNCESLIFLIAKSPTDLGKSNRINSDKIYMIFVVFFHYYLRNISN